MTKYNKQNSKKVQDIQHELNGAELIHSDGSADDEIKALNQPILYKPTECDIVNYTFRFGIYKGCKAIDVIDRTTMKVTQAGNNYADRTGYKYIKFLLKEVNLLPRDKIILSALLRQYYAKHNPQSN